MRDVCKAKEPEMCELRPRHFVSCHPAEQLQLLGVG